MLALREWARDLYGQAYGISASKMKAKVHHRQPLEYAHVAPGSDPNRLANLVALRDKVHNLASAEWRVFKRSLGGKMPTPNEIMKETLRIDKKIDPYIRRPGVSRSRTDPKKGGPI